MENQVNWSFLRANKTNYQNKKTLVFKKVKQVQLPDDTALSVTMTWMTENLVQHVST